MTVLLYLYETPPKTSRDCMNQIDEDVYIHMSYILRARILAKISIYTGILVLPQIYVCIKNKPA